MKKILFPILLFVLSLNASDSLDVVTIAGFKGGSGLAFFSSNISKAYKTEKPVISYDFGVFASREYYQQLALSLELLVRRRGGVHRTEYPLEAGQLEYRETGLNLLYVEMPIIVKFRIGDDWKYAPSIYAGLNPAFNISAKQTYEDEISSGENELTSLESSDTGVIFGLEIWRKLGSNNLLIDFRLNSSLKLHTTDYMDAVGHSRGEYQFTTYGINMHIGYAFTL